MPIVNSPDTDLAAWVGRSETVHDIIGPTPVAALTATLDHPAAAVPAGLPLPPLWHWLYFLPLHRQSEIGPDGHAQRGGFLPPVPLPRRMWAGGQFEFHAPVRVGDAVARRSTIADVTQKAGRSGKLVFVKVRHELFCKGAEQPALTEFHDIVYREAKQPGDVDPPPVAAPGLAVEEVSGTASPGPETRPLGGQRPQGAWGRTIVPDDVLLFRYSALTFNGHRIHYDRRYVTQVEGYPGLVVHGPLIATLLMDLLRRHAPEAEVASFRFKAVRPTFDLHPFRVNGRRDGSTVKLWAEDHEGWLTMDAVATLKA
ncbi:MAG: acyl-CoA dehydrogenase [Leptothrix sp. (in: Bacteria)]|nr:acyl-CoA dehydrogenase [Leptothrix sp. (in: b-proteobacteria)]